MDTMKALRRAWLVRLKNRDLYCALCGCIIEKPSDVSVEHEPPKSRQFELGVSQLYPAHKTSCNNVKGALEFSEYQLWLLLNRVRTGGTDKRDLETLSRIREYLRSIKFGQRAEQKNR